jgi:mevalonate kinase
MEIRTDTQFAITIKDYDIQELISAGSQDLTQIQPHYQEIFPIWQIISKMFNTYGLHKGLTLEIWSEIPIGVGLGSSAAIAVATVAALNNLFQLQLGPSEISQHAFEGEKVTHATPSGIDNTISTYGGAILYKKGKINRIEIPHEIPLLIINTGISRQTKTQVNQVANLYKEHPTIIKPIFQAIDAISLKTENALRLQKIALLGELLNFNQHLLRILGVSTKELDSLINLVLSNGALGAKLTGAGGGGCIIALFDSITAKQNCIAQLQSLNIGFYDTTISQIGAQILHTAK